jgi:dihydroflavonol-4-reductase
MVQKASREGLDAVIVCPTGVIGPYDFRESEIGRLILSAAHGKLQFWLKGGYDFVDVRDVARGMILACRKGRSGETYILGCEHITVKRIFETIVEITGMRAMCLYIPTGLARLAARVAAVYYTITRTRPIFTPYSLETVLSNSAISWAKASRELGYSPRSLRESIADTIKWMNAYKGKWRTAHPHRR